MNEWERQYHESIAAENAALGVASLEYEPTLKDLQSYLWALTFPAALLGVASVSYTHLTLPTNREV